MLALPLLCFEPGCYSPLGLSFLFLERCIWDLWIRVKAVSFHPGDGPLSHYLSPGSLSGPGLGEKKSREMEDLGDGLTQMLGCFAEY